MPHIVQIAAVELKNESIFNTYVRPKMTHTKNARLVTGIVANSSGMSSEENQWSWTVFILLLIYLSDI